jgi:hypothetical protein
VPDRNFVDFKPAWMRDLSQEDRILEETPFTGSIPEGPPRIHTRILPADGSNTVSAQTLSEAIDLAQAIVRYAGCDVYHGPNPDFADLRSLSAEVLELTRLTVEPFDEGSFVIPAKLTAPALAQRDTAQPRLVSTQDVVSRFDEWLASFNQPQETSRVSIGAIQAIESLGRLIRREAQAIEFSSFDVVGQPSRPITVDAPYIEHVRQVRASRQPTCARLETLEGTVTAIDIVQGTLQLSIEGQARRVKGTFSMLFQPSLSECLGRRVRLQGPVERTARRTVSIQVTNVEVPDNES